MKRRRPGYSPACCQVIAELAPRSEGDLTERVIGVGHSSAAPVTTRKIGMANIANMGAASTKLARCWTLRHRREPDQQAR